MTIQQKSQDFFQSVLKNGGADSYNKWANEYDSILKSHNSQKGANSTVSVWMRYHPEESLRSLGRKHKIYDAGCGTGMVGESLVKAVSPDLYELHGGDISPGMIEVAKPKNCYAGLKVDDLKAQLSYEEETFDSIVSVGVFLQAHCGPECLPNIFRVLKKGGYFVTTCRKPFYEETKDDWDKAIKDYNCELVEITEIPYSDQATAVALVILKN